MNLRSLNVRPGAAFLALALVLGGTQGVASASEDSGSVLARSLDEALEAVGAPEASPNQDAEVPRDAGSPLKLTGDDGSTLEMVLPAKGRGKQMDDGLTTVFAGEADESIIAAQPTDEGIRGLVNITSPDAPERFEFPIEGDVATLMLEPEGGVLALGSDGELMAHAERPWAVDEQGSVVPTHFEVEGTTLVQVVEHRGGTWEYGIIADPAWAAVIAVAGWCATGALSGVGSQALLDIYHGKKSSRTAYVENVVVGCVLGSGTGVGKLAWKFLPGATKDWVIRQVLRFVLWAGPKSRF